MRISNKISLLIIFLIGILLANTYIGIRELNKIGQELKQVASKDVVLTEISTLVRRYQLKKMILFERMVRIAEEFENEDVGPARRQYLIDHAHMIKGGFDNLAQSGAKQIIKAKELLGKGLRHIVQSDQQSEIDAVEKAVSSIESAHIRYDALVLRMFELIAKGDYQSSIRDIDRVQNQEKRISKELDHLLKDIQGFTKRSLDQAALREQRAERVLWIASVSVTTVSLILLFFLIQGIARPLKNLVGAAHKIARGFFDVNLDDRSKDEIGEVSAAINMMSKELDKAQKELEGANEELAENLEITQKQKSDLEKVNKELDNFAHTVSHDIRSPLMGIMGYGSILETQYSEKMDERGQKCVKGVRQGVDRLNTMIDDLLALTRIARVQNPYEKIDMSDLIETVLGRLEYKIKEHRVDLIVPENLPTLVCDRIKMAEVFLNLINNAIKFSVEGIESRPRVEIGYRDQPVTHEFFVKDNGIGIAPDNHDDVFGVFKRIDTSGKFEGTGVGLTIVKTVIDDHGGKVWIDSDLGKGATFIFTIPKNLSV